VGSWSKEIVEGNPYVDELIIFDNPFYDRTILSQKSVLQKIKYINIKKIIEFVILLRNSHYDLVIDPSGSFASTIFTYLSGAKYKVGRDIRGRNFLFDIKIKDYGIQQEVDRCLNMLRTIGICSDHKKPILTLSNEEKEFAKNFFNLNNISENDLVVGIHPGAPWIPRRWPKERFAKIADEIIEKYGAKIIFFGGQKEVKLVDDILFLMKNKNKALSVAGKTTIKQLAAVIEKCNLFIGNDSSPMHIAATFKVPVIGLFGPGEYPRFAPFGRNNIVIRKPIKCSPCRQKIQFTKCWRGRSYCMEAITVRDVMDAVEKMMLRLKRLSK